MTTVIMTHGAFSGGWAFERFRAPFEARGWQVLCPDLRGHGPDASGLDVVGVSMTDYAEDLARLCAEQPEPPVLVGHSMGGLVSLMAAQQASVRALLLLCPSPPWGIAGASLEEAVTALGVQMLSPLSSGAVAPDPVLMRLHSLNRLPRAEQDAIIARMRPESGRALREVLNWWLDPFMATSLGAGPARAPALCLVGENDLVHPARTARLTAERVGAGLQIMPRMSHWLVAEPGWETVAYAGLSWLDQLDRAAA